MTKFLVAAFLLFQFLYGVLAKVDCGGELPKGYLKYAGDNKFLKMHDEQLSWERAREVCRSEGADLAVAVTPEKIDYIRKGVGPGWIWIGIHRPGGRWGNWVRVDTGEIIPSSAPWNHIIESINFHCAFSYTSDKISDYNCHFELPFACEISPAEGCPGSTGDAAVPGPRGVTGYCILIFLYIFDYVIAYI